MDEQATSTAPVADSAPVNEPSTPEPSSPEPDTAPQESPSQPEPTDPAPQTDDPDMPDHGINPDKGIDPDAGDEPSEDHNTAGEPVDQVDLSKMTRKERAEYFAEANQRTQRQVEQAVNEAYQPQPVDELKQAYLDVTDEYGNPVYDDFQATVLAEREVEKQEKQIAEARAEIAELNMAIQTDAVEVMSTLDWANPSNKTAYDKTTTELAGQLYQELATVRDPRTGQIIDTKMPLKTFYGLVDQIRSASSAQASIKAQKAAEAQMAAVAPSSSATQTRETPFAELSLEQQRAKLRAQGHYIT